MEKYAVESKILVQQRGANLKQCPIQAAGATLQPTIISNITRIQQGFKFTFWLPLTSFLLWYTDYLGFYVLFVLALNIYT